MSLSTSWALKEPNRLASISGGPKGLGGENMQERKIIEMGPKWALYFLTITKLQM